MRIYAAVGAFLGWFALALQLYLMLANSPARGVAQLGTVITFFSFFTILTNLLVAMVFTGAALRGGWQWLRSQSVQAATAVFISIVGIIYELLLRQLWNPQGAQWLADVLLHVLLPAGYVLYWLVFAPKQEIRWKDAIVWLAYPAVYLVYILARGAATGLYPYPFLNVTQLGYGAVSFRAGMFVLVFLMIGLLVVAVARWTQRSPVRSVS